MLIKDILKAKDKILVIYVQGDENVTMFIPINNILIITSEPDEEVEKEEYFLFVKGRDFPLVLSEEELEETEIL